MQKCKGYTIAKVCTLYCSIAFRMIVRNSFDFVELGGLLTHPLRHSTFIGQIFSHSPISWSCCAAYSRYGRTNVGLTASVVVELLIIIGVWQHDIIFLHASAWSSQHSRALLWQ